MYVIKRTHDDGSVSYYKDGAGANNPIEKAQFYVKEKDAIYRLKEEINKARVYRDAAEQYPHCPSSNLVAKVEIVEVELIVREKQ